MLLIAIINFLLKGINNIQYNHKTTTNSFCYINFKKRYINFVFYSLSHKVIEIPKNKKLILFDGVCNLCNNAVLKVIKYDQKNTFIFTALQSEAGKKVTEYLHINTAKVDSIILYEPGVAYDLKSTAALKVMKDFGGLWHINRLGLLFPESFRDFVYDFIAKNRYKWFGKKESCMLPTAELKSKFLD